jgi:glutamine amidotransferase
MMRGMCRLLGYLGPTLRLGQLVESPPHSLEHQSYAPREMRGAVVNADGWGAGWYLEPEATGRASDPTPCVYRSTLPIWADVNRAELGRAVVSRCVVAAVRSATDPLSVSAANTQPFRSEQLLFVHNGFIEGFGGRLRHELAESLSDAARDAIRGSTDSEVIFARLTDAWRDLPADAERLVNAVSRAVGYFVTVSEEQGRRALFTVLVTDGTELVAVRAAVNDAAPTLYVRQEAAVWIASEPLDAEPGWQLIPENQLVIVRPGAARRTLALP